MSKRLFAAGGEDAPKMVGVPASVEGAGNGVLPPGTTEVTSFEAAKEFARGEAIMTGSYTPLLRPGRRAERIATPDAPTQVGVKTL